MTPQLQQLINEKYRYPCLVILRDIKKTNHRSLFAVKALMEKAHYPCVVHPRYNNRNTGRRNVEVRFTDEARRDAALDFIDLHFPNFSVHGEEK